MALPSPLRMTLSPGVRLGPYEILAAIGSGGMGEVYRARDIRLERTVAIKVLPARFASDGDRRRRFEREAKAVSQLNHPHICALYDVGLENGAEYLVLEYLEGHTLANRLQSGSVPLGEALTCAMQIADALNAAHQRGIVHRDLKPANIMLTKTGAKVLDFGIARVETPLRGPASGTEAPRAGATLSTLTAEGILLGTVQYMSPEQLEGREADARSDIFALGAVLYEILTGQRAFAGDSQAAVMAAILDAEPRPIRAFQPRVPSALERIVRRCLAKHPQDRWQTSHDLLSALRDVRALTPWQHRVRSFGILSATVLAVAAGAVFVWRHAHVKPLTDKDVLVLADFTNTTGNGVFDGALRSALSIQLEQSPFLKIMSETQARQDLRFMGRPNDERITNEVAREICHREGEKATIGGSIAPLGKTYVLTIEATDCQTGESLAREQTQADDQEHVLPAVAQAVKSIRVKLGESLASIQKLDRPQGQATTTSLEAFDAYSFGMRRLVQGEGLAAIPFFKKATDLDPNFAMAWEMWSVARWSTPEGEAYEKKAFALLDHATGERERLFIESNYYRDIAGDMTKIADVNEVYARTYPREGPPHFNFAQLHQVAGEYEEAAQEFEIHNRLEPRVSTAYAALIHNYARLERFDAARMVAATAIALQMDGPDVHRVLLAMAYQQGDQVAVDKENQWFAEKPEAFWAVQVAANDAKTRGQRRKAAELFQRAADLARQQNLPSTAAQLLTPDPLTDAFVGNCETVRSHAPGTSDAVAMALCGEAASSQKAVDETSKRMPTNTLWNFVGAPTVQAAIFIANRQPEQAIEALRPAARYERGQTNVIYLRGLAYLSVGNGAEAAAEFQKILSHKGESWGSVVLPLSFVGLARAAALRGDVGRAKKAYSDFFSFWKDADPDIPILIEAKREFDLLKNN